MKGFVGVTDNDWFEFLSQQLPYRKQPAIPPHNRRIKKTADKLWAKIGKSYTHPPLTISH